MENTENSFIIYPIHINAGVTLSNGRKYSLESSVEHPTFKEIRNALTSLNIIFREEENKIHPKESKEKGRFIVNEKSERKHLINNLSKAIKDIRNKKEQASEKSKMANNFLNLKPKSKKKSKNN